MSPLQTALKQISIDGTFCSVNTATDSILHWQNNENVRNMFYCIYLLMNLMVLPDFAYRCFKKGSTGCICQLTGVDFIHLCITAYAQVNEPCAAQIIF